MFNNLFWEHYVVYGVISGLFAMHESCWKSAFCKEFGLEALKKDHRVTSREMSYIIIHSLYVIVVSITPIVNGIYAAIYASLFLRSLIRRDSH